jgi:hypothetical protein
MWDGFGDKFRWWFEGNRKSITPKKCGDAIEKYITTGECH